MTKQEFLAFSLPYGLKLFNKNCEHKRMYEMDGLFTPNAVHCKETNRVDYFHCEIMPILRPLSDLTKEIEHNGEKFIPALELVKLEERYNNWKDIAPTIPYDIKIINKPFGKVLKVSKVEHWVIYLSLNEIERAKYYIVSQLIKWKFDIANLIPKGEAIDVNTLEINPYK